MPGFSFTTLSSVVMISLVGGGGGGFLEDIYDDFYKL